MTSGFKSDELQMMLTVRSFDCAHTLRDDHPHGLKSTAALVWYQTSRSCITIPSTLLQRRLNFFLKVSHSSCSQTFIFQPTLQGSGLRR